MFVKKYIIIAFLFSIIYSIKNVTITKKKEKVSLSDSVSKEVLFIIDVLEVNVSDYIFFRIYKKKKNYHIHFSIKEQVKIMN